MYRRSLGYFLEPPRKSVFSEITMLWTLQTVRVSDNAVFKEVS
jgi:hypothetical protein